MTDPAAEFLYSAPRSERAFDDPVGCYEAEFDGDNDRTPRTIEKWTAATPARDLPSVEYTIEWVVEHATMETTEDGAADWEEAGKRGDVKAAFRAALDMLAGHVRYRLCDRRVGTLTVTWNDAGEPFLDGQPLHKNRMTA